MAEPARQLPEENHPEVRPDLPGLRALEGGGETSKPRRGHLSPVDDSSSAIPKSSLAAAESGDEKLFNPAGDDTGVDGESGGTGGLYNQSGSSSMFGSVKGWWGNLNKKRAGIIGGLILGFGGGGIGLFLLLLPLKIEHMVSNLQNTFFSSSEAAVEKQSDRLFQRYLITRVFPAYQSCGSTVSKKCTAHVTGQGPVSSLYNSWSNAKLETTMADGGKGIEFRYHRYSNTWSMHYPGSSREGDDIGTNGNRLSQQFDSKNDARKAFRSEFNKRFENETKWKKVMYRYKYGRLVETKYGIKRCIVFCGTRDAIGDKREDKKNAAKLYLVKRVIEPRNETLGIALQCLLSGCDPTKTEPSGEGDATNGQPKNEETDAKMQAKLAELSAKGFDLEAMKALSTEISETGFQKYLTSKALTPIIGETAAGRAGNVVPIVGWVNLAAQIVGAGDNAGPALKKLSFLVNSSAAVGTYMTYRTYADEIHMSKVDATEIGSFTDTLSSGNHGAESDPIVGGTAGAEGTPLYASLIDGKSKGIASNNVSIINSILPSASAAENKASTEESDYKCNNGNPVPAGQLVCSEEVLGGGNAIANSVHDFLNLPGIGVITDIANAWNGSVGKVFDFAGGVLGSAIQLAVKPLDAACGIDIPYVGNPVPGADLYCSAKDLAEEAIPAIVEGVTKWLIPNPFSTNMSGGRTFDMMAAGADVAGNDFAHTSLGAKQISDEQAAKIRSDRSSTEENNFSKQSLYARLFDTDSRYSLVSKVAMRVPFGKQAAAQQGFASITNPFKTIGTGFSSMLSGRVNAATTDGPDPFGVTQYGFDENEIPEDPESYWNENCSDNAAYAYRKTNDWNTIASQTIDPNNGTPMNTTSNPCLLIMASVGSAGGWFDSDNLTDDDLANLQSESGTSSEGTTEASVELDMDHLYESSADIKCSEGTKDIGVQDGYHDGKKIPVRVCAITDVPETGDTSELRGADGKLLVNSRLSAFYVGLIKDAKSSGVGGISAQEGFRTMARQTELKAQYGDGAAEPGYSNHQMGLAVDWGDSMVAYLNKDSHGLKALVSGESWHWSPTGY